MVAFPLAPLFALLNNIFEMRLDAKKFLKFYRRPVPCRVKDIGVWFNIMAILSRISTASSAFIIAFSSNFIPRLVYTMSVNTADHSDAGYLNFTLSSFATKDFQVRFLCTALKWVCHLLVQSFKFKLIGFLSGGKAPITIAICE